MATRRLRVLTWNLHGAGRPDLRRVAELLGEVAADVVALQEVRRGQAAELVTALAPADASWTLKHLPFGPLLPSAAEGLALLLPERAAVRSLVLTPGVSRWVARRRVAQVADLDGLGVRVVNTHLDAHEAARRLPQAELLAAELGGARRAVLLGDLNANPAEQGVFELLAGAGMRDAWSVEAGSAVESFTSPAAAPVQRIDHVLVSDEVVVDHVGVPPGEWARWSDHLPVVADLLLPAR